MLNVGLQTTKKAINFDTEFSLFDDVTSHTELDVVKAKGNTFYLLLYSAKTGQIVVKEFLFNRDEVKEDSGFKFPLMFVGIGIAFFYNLCLRDNKSGNKGKYAAATRVRRAQNDMYRLNKFGKK